ncbi:MAG: hypothetical protein A2Y00_09765 [Omnitrophica WOR_2 bacterium GWF2_43_52]|nr:MAG: hypothetical protein A2Y01_00545 [Omnitrophica WOR_2 bacterium GWC2_44_8]OGX21516.1 MAG: hypothetical protein A2Y00_09765 [Omnitrophica WOR_2 bacterium GWF2_43_52]OGX53586.1 MAG: hypothetical protein A2460_00565 [Omnitrophica WOR_2 bacterium RIFOXYC2_FULL_43_9]HAH19401.1 hypothetical protein [Candidatus Omnitrophota bacterium]HBG63772.1 hypothetical protein [Candidatus Omnitrophota bacterium]
MAHITHVPLNFEEAWDLADLEGRKHDLEWVKEVSQKYLQCFDKISDFIIHDVFCSAIIVRYGRAHNKGRKKIMPAECFKGLTQEEKDKHNFFMNLRNKHYAHSANNYEYNIPKAWIRNIDSPGPEFDQVGVVHERIVGLSIQEIRDIMSLVEKLLPNLENKIKETKNTVTEIAKRISISELIKNKFPEILTTKESAGQPRKRKL